MLDRLRLNLNQQRLILVGSGQSIEFEAIRDAATLHFPDHRHDGGKDGDRIEQKVDTGQIGARRLKFGARFLAWDPDKKSAWLRVG